VHKTYEASAAKGRISADEARKRTQSISGTLHLEDLAQCDLVIEAVYEGLTLKREICARLGAICRPGAIIASNTSTLNVDVLAQATGRPADALGMHFFSPANVMRLLEVVRGEKTAPDVLATAMQLAKRIGKVPIVSGVCYGFIGNRMLEPYLRETEFLLMEGATPAQIDGALEALGLAMGPCRMLDMAGVDVGANIVLERIKAGDAPPDPAYRAVVRRMFELGRRGQKTALGYYRYDGRKALDDPAADEICAALAREHGIARRTAITSEEIVERCLYPLINEGARILEEGIAYRPGDIDVVFTSGFGFPDFRGGPMWMADEIGLARVVERMDDYARRRGNAFGYWNVAGLLRECADGGKRVSSWRSSPTAKETQ
jgi:3-hydroxyacyl-CoA dehydrogenase